LKPHDPAINASLLHTANVALRRVTTAFTTKLLLAYCCVGILLFPLYQYQVNPDGISYINIARLYSVGDLHDAINAYWGPLTSWLLVPLLLVNLQPALALQLLSLIFGALTTIATIRLSSIFILTDRARSLALLTAIIIILSYTFFASVPDLLFLCISLFYLSYIFAPDYNRTAISGVIIGLLGSLLYLDKSYGLYLFMAHFTLFTYIHYLQSNDRRERRIVLLKYVLGLSCLAIISGIWIHSLSDKYQHFTISTTAQYNIKIDSLGSQGQPMHSQGLLPLPYPSAVSAWDDPSRLTVEYEKSPRLRDWVRWQIFHIAGNVFRTFYYLELFSVFSIVIVLIYASYYFISRVSKAEEGGPTRERRSGRRSLQLYWGQDHGKLHSSVVYSLVTMLLYTAGYEVLHVESRFLWIDSILLLLLCAHYISNSQFCATCNVKLRLLMTSIIFSSFCLYPLMQIIIHANQNRYIYITARELHNNYHVEGSIASNDNGGDGWDLTLFYAFYLDSKYYGATKKSITDEELQRELGKYRIQYYFSWDDVCRLSECRKLADFEVEFLWTTEKKHLIVYQIRNVGS